MRTTAATLGTWLRAGAALLVMVALAAGVPWLLVVTVGNPLPADGWGWSQPLTDEAFLGLVAILAWLFWAQLMVCLLVELAAEVGLAVGRSADWMMQIPGTFGGQQYLARMLVQAIVAVGIGTAMATSPAVHPVGEVGVASAEPLAHSHPASATPPVTGPQADSTRVNAADPSRPVEAPAAEWSGAHSSHAVVEVVRGDTLWSIAERHLGAGEQWRRIADLNQGRVMQDGHRFTHASSLQPGWQLRLPTAPSSGALTEESRHVVDVVVEPGDTLWGLAEVTYGDGAAWPSIYRANRDQISDPDLIHPGQRLDLPAPDGRHTGTPSQTEPDHTRPAATDTTSPRRSVPEPLAAPAPPEAPDPPRHPINESRPAPEPSAGTDRAASTRTVEHHDDASSASEHLAQTLVAGGSLLAGGALAVLVAHRRRQFRHRRSGRAIAATPPELVSAEATLRSTGSAGGESAAFLDRALRDLSCRLAREGAPLPEVAAVRLTDDRIQLMLVSPDSEQPPPMPWEATGDRWSLARGHPFLDRRQDENPLAPYPALVAVGTAEDGATWLLDLEAFGVLQLVGDQTACEDLARFIAAELAVNVWSDDVDVTIAGPSADLVGLNPIRLRHQDQPDVAVLVKTAHHVREAATSSGGSVLAGRLTGRGADSWMPTIHVTTPVAVTDRFRNDVERLLDELDAHHGRLATALVTTVGQRHAAGMTLRVDADRHLVLDRWNVALSANQLTSHDAGVLADLLSAHDTEADVPMPPASGGRPIDEVSDAAGALRIDHTGDRDGATCPGSLLPSPDHQYLSTAATTPSDLAALAPPVDDQTRRQVCALDPDLDADLAAWSDPDTPRPQLRLLGPVELRASGERTADVDRRCAYFTEVVAYLATRPHGATPEQVAEAFHVQTNTIHSRVGTVRKWLGTDSTTGEWYLPESTLSPSAKKRGIPVYEVTQLLVDADLFRRLRVRAQAGGAAGMDDLVAALHLVRGRPFDQLRTGGYGWLAETPVDQYLTAGIVDTAHVVATHALANGQPPLARWASEIAISAAPSEDKPRLDLAAALAASGDATAAERYVHTAVLNRSDDRWTAPSPSSRADEGVAALRREDLS